MLKDRIDKEKVQDQLNYGVSIAYIAHENDCTSETLKAWMRKNDLKPKKKINKRREFKKIMSELSAEQVHKLKIKLLDKRRAKKTVANVGDLHMQTSSCIRYVNDELIARGYVVRKGVTTLKKMSVEEERW